MKPIFDKHFTLEQANALIPHVRRLFAEVRALLSYPNGENAEPGVSQKNGADGNGHSKNGHSHPNGNGDGHGAPAGPGAFGLHSATPETASTDYSNWSDEKRHEAAYRLLNALQSQGIVIQDVERGLIDFPSLRNGREVFLCYELSDGLSIHYFHEIEAGFAGRQLITENDE